MSIGRNYPTREDELILRPDAGNSALDEVYSPQGADASPIDVYGPEDLEALKEDRTHSDDYDPVEAAVDAFFGKEPISRRQSLGRIAAGIAAAAGLGSLVSEDAYGAGKPTIYMDVKASCMGAWCGNVGTDGLADTFEMRFPEYLGRFTNRYGVEFERPDSLQPTDFTGKVRLVVDTDRGHMLRGNLKIKEHGTGKGYWVKVRSNELGPIMYNMADKIGPWLNKRERARNRSQHARR